MKKPLVASQGCDIPGKTPLGTSKSPVVAEGRAEAALSTGARVILKFGPQRPCGACTLRRGRPGGFSGLVAPSILVCNASTSLGLGFDQPDE